MTRNKGELGPSQQAAFLLAALLTLLSLPLLQGCSPKVFTWKEEVQLLSSETFIVQRTISFKEYQPWSGGGGGSDIVTSTLDVISPNRPDNPRRWSHPPLIPMLLDSDPGTHEWLIVTTFYMCTAWYDLGRPKLPYAQFRFRDGQWRQEPLSEQLVGREANLLVPNQADVGKNHTLASKRGIMSNPAISVRHRRIVSNWMTNC